MILHNATRVGRNPTLRADSLHAYVLTRSHACMSTCLHAHMRTRLHALAYMFARYMLLLAYTRLYFYMFTYLHAYLRPHVVPHSTHVGTGQI